MDRNTLIAEIDEQFDQVEKSGERALKATIESLTRALGRLAMYMRDKQTQITALVAQIKLLYKSQAEFLVLNKENLNNSASSEGFYRSIKMLHEDFKKIIADDGA